MIGIVSWSKASARRLCGFVANRAFNNNFEIVIADTDSLKRESYKLRYQIFCKERGFDMAAVEGHETDEYDSRSVHFLIWYKVDNLFIGTGRIILPDSLHSETPLPLLKILHPDIASEHQLRDPQKLRTMCEISRLGILRKYARNDRKIYKTLPCLSSRLLKSKIADIGKLGLYRGIFEIAHKLTGTPDCLFSTDSWLLKRFASLGFGTYTVLERDIENFGPVTAVTFNVHTMLENARTHAPEAWSVLSNSGTLLKTGLTESVMHNPVVVDTVADVDMSDAIAEAA